MTGSTRSYRTAWRHQLVLVICTTKSWWILIRVWRTKAVSRCRLVWPAVETSHLISVSMVTRFFMFLLMVSSSRRKRSSTVFREYGSDQSIWSQPTRFRLFLPTNTHSLTMECAPILRSMRITSIHWKNSAFLVAITDWMHLALCRVSTRGRNVVWNYKSSILKTFKPSQIHKSSW